MATRAIGGYLWAAKLAIRLNDGHLPKHVIKIKLLVNELSSNRYYIAEVECQKSALMIFDKLPVRDETAPDADQQFRTEDMDDNEVLICTPDPAAPGGTNNDSTGGAKASRQTAIRIYYTTKDELAIETTSAHPIRLNDFSEPLPAYVLIGIRAGDILHYSEKDAFKIVDVTIDLCAMDGVAAWAARQSLLLPRIPGFLILYLAMQNVTPYCFPWMTFWLAVFWLCCVDRIVNRYIFGKGFLGYLKKSDRDTMLKSRL